MGTVAQHFMNPEDLAEYLGISVATVYGWRYKGEGPPGLKVGRHVRYRLADVERWLDQQADPRTAA